MVNDAKASNQWNQHAGESKQHKKGASTGAFFFEKLFSICVFSAVYEKAWSTQQVRVVGTNCGINRYWAYEQLSGVKKHD